MNANYYNNYYSYARAEMYHHGILGQRWGKRNGPPYPLGASDHSASEKKAGWMKSLAKGAAAAGRGTVKVAKAVGKGTVKTAKFVNKTAVRMGVKPRKLMSDAEIEYSIKRLKQEKTLQRALKGKFIDVTEAERNKGKGFIKEFMDSVGKDLIIPTAVGALRYKLATSIAGEHTEGEKVLSKVETIFGGGRGVGFRNDYFYDKYGRPTYREKGGKKNKGGNSDGGGGNNGNNNPQNQPSQPKPKPVNVEKPKASDSSKPETSASPVASANTPSQPRLTKAQALGERIYAYSKPVGGKSANTLIREANQVYNKNWKQGSGYTAANNQSHLAAKTAALNDLVGRYDKYNTADKIFEAMQDGKFNETEIRKFRYGR